jgi:hypothetical protein
MRDRGPGKATDCGLESCESGGPFAEWTRRASRAALRLREPTRLPPRPSPSVALTGGADSKQDGRSREPTRPLVDSGRRLCGIDRPISESGRGLDESSRRHAEPRRRLSVSTRQTSKPEAPLRGWRCSLSEPPARPREPRGGYEALTAENPRPTRWLMLPTRRLGEGSRRYVQPRRWLAGGGHDDVRANRRSASVTCGHAGSPPPQYTRARHAVQAGVRSAARPGRAGLAASV